MRVLLYLHGEDDADRWLAEIGRHLPGCVARLWQPGDEAPADYALVWAPPAEVLRGRSGLKAVFNLGAGVDALLRHLKKEPDLLPPGVPLLRLDDAGMGEQMVEYVLQAVLYRFRRMDEYAQQQARQTWHPLPPRDRRDYPVGVMGLGVLGARVATALAGFGFPVRGWSRSPKELEGVSTFDGPDQLSRFLTDLSALVNLLPLTPDTNGLLDQQLFAQLKPGAHLINIGRGAHLVEQDLLAAIAAGQVGFATLDVFSEEPLPPSHPFWNEQRIAITPHVAAVTLREEALAQIARKIADLERGESVRAVVDLDRGY